MSANYVLTITSPNGENSIEAFPTDVILSVNAQEVSAMQCTFEYGWDWYNNEDNPANPIQTNSYTTITRNETFIFRGFIDSRILLEGGGDGAQVFDIVCLDPIGKLEYCLASINGDTLFTRITQKVVITENVLKAGEAIGDTKFPFFPTPNDTDPWIPSSVVNSTVLDVDINNIEVIIVATTSQEGILPQGIIRIEDEWIQYDGYDTFDITGKYRFKNCVRGALGTPAATHLATEIIYQRVSEKVHPVVPILMEGNLTGTGTWEPIPADDYIVQIEEGRFDFTYNVLNFPVGDPKYQNVRASYAVFDGVLKVIGNVSGASSTWNLIDLAASFVVDGISPGDIVTLDVGGETATVETVSSGGTQLLTTPLSNGGTYDATEAYTVTKNSIVTLKGILTDVLTESVANGGPGFLESELSLDTIIDILITRIRVPEAVNCLDFIKNLLDDLGFASGDSEDALLFYYDHKDGKIVIAPTSQEETVDADLSYSNMVLIDRDISLEDVYTGALIEYTAGQNENLIAQERMWHPSQNDETVGSNAEKVFLGIIQEEEEPVAAGWKRHDGFTNNTKTELITDGIETSGWGLRFKNDPGERADVLYCWFNDAVSNFTVDNVRVVIDARRESRESNPYHLEILGIDTNFDKVDPSNIPEANKINISGALDLRYADGGTDAFNKVVLEAKDIGISLQGLVIRYNGMSTDDGGANWFARIKEITVTGHLTKSALIQLTDNDNPSVGSKFIYSPISLAKLIGSTLGQPRIQILSVGQATQDSAISLGRLVVLQGLVYRATRDYEMHAFNDSVVPVIGQTATFQDGFTGIVLGYTFAIRSEEVLGVNVLDYTNVLV